MPVHDSPKILTELVAKHLGTPIIVMGGSPTLKDDLDLIPGDIQATAVYISANEHGVKLRPVDYVVCNDRYHQQTKEYMPDRIRQHTDSPIISHRFLGNYRIHNYNIFRVKTNSGLNAILVATLMGGWPVIGCGLSMYTGDGTYWHDPSASSSGKQRPLNVQLKRAWSVQQAVVPAPVRIVSGPLTNIWPQYTPRGAMGQLDQYRRHTDRLRLYALQRVDEWVVTHGGHRLCTVGVDVPFETGQRVWLTPTEARGIQHWIKEVK